MDFAPLVLSIIQQKRKRPEKYSDLIVSVRKVIPGYTGYCMQVRRDSDNALQNIGFIGNDLDTESLLSFVGAGNGYVRTWYDQSTNGNNAIQTTNNSQPKIVNSGSVIVENERPTLQFDGSDDYLPFGNISVTNSVVSCFAVAKCPNSGTPTIVGVRPASSYRFIMRFSSSSFQLYDGLGVKGSQVTDNVLQIVSAVTSTSGTSMRVDGVKYTYTGNWGINDVINSIGSSDAGNYFTSVISEVILFSSDQSSNRDYIEISSSAYFNIGYLYPVMVGSVTIFGSASLSSFSLRLLDESYTRNECLMVRRDSDNFCKIIGFDDGVLDEADLLDFVGSNNGYVKFWYDQSGNANHAYNLTLSKQPQIVASGSIVKTYDKPALTYSSGGDDNLIMQSELTTIRSVFEVSNPCSPTSRWNSILGDTGSYNFCGREQTSGYFYGMTASFYRNGYPITTTSTPKINEQQQLSVFPTANQKANTISYDRNISNRSFEGDGVVQEIAIYSSDQSSNRTTIEANQNSFYSINLHSDLKSEYSGALAAYSLRNLGTSDIGYCINVRRSSDNKTMRIGFVDGELDVDTLETFCSGTDGYIEQWYDQSGNKRDAVQIITSKQPQIVVSGSVITNNGKPAFTMRSDGGDFLRMYIDMTTIRSVFCVCNPYSSTSIACLLGHTASYNFHGLASATGYFSGHSSLYVRNGAFYRNGSSITTTTTARTDAQQLLSLFTTGNCNANLLVSDRGSLNSSFTGTGVLQEIICFGSDKSSDRTTIESDINGFYAIY